MPLLLSAGISTALAAPCQAAAWIRLSITKYVTPLVIPPVLFDDQGGTTPIDGEIAVRPITQQILPDRFPATPLWGYGDPTRPATFFNPAFTVEATQNSITTIRWTNELVADPEDCRDLQAGTKSVTDD